MEKNEENVLNIDLSEEVASGIYSNLVIISHSPTEFVLDFVQIFPGIPKGRVRSRVIMAPQHFKRLLHAMQDNLQKYEHSFGPVEIVSPSDPPISFGPIAKA
ncbi:MAG: DUF3467 domain-containing protein [Bacteroidia bacterium]